MEPKYPPETDLIRIRNTILTNYLRCGINYEFSVNAGRRIARVPMLVGSAVARGAEYDNRWKIERGTDTPAPLKEVINKAVEEYENELEITEVRNPRHEIIQGKDDTANAAREYSSQASKQIMSVIAAEEPILLPFDNKYELAGTPDVITALGVGDLKTGQPWGQERTDKSWQLTAYGILHRHAYGNYPRRVWIDSLSKGSGGAWMYNRTWGSRNRQDYLAYVQIVRRTIKNMEAGVAQPAAEGAWWCSKRWCPYWDECTCVIGRAGE